MAAPANSAPSTAAAARFGRPLVGAPKTAPPSGARRSGATPLSSSIVPEDADPLGIAATATAATPPPAGSMPMPILAATGTATGAATGTATATATATRTEAGAPPVPPRRSESLPVAPVAPPPPVRMSRTSGVPGRTIPSPGLGPDGGVSAASPGSTFAGASSATGSATDSPAEVAKVPVYTIDDSIRDFLGPSAPEPVDPTKLKPSVESLVLLVSVRAWQHLLDLSVVIDPLADAKSQDDVFIVLLRAVAYAHLDQPGAAAREISRCGDLDYVGPKSSLKVPMWARIFRWEVAMLQGGDALKKAVAGLCVLLKRTSHDAHLSKSLFADVEGIPISGFKHASLELSEHEALVWCARASVVLGVALRRSGKPRTALKVLYNAAEVLGDASMKDTAGPSVVVVGHPTCSTRVLILSELGRMYLQCGHLSGASEAFGKAHELASTESDSIVDRLNMGLFGLAKGEVTLAARDFTACLESTKKSKLDPESKAAMVAIAANNIAIAAIQDGELGAAVKVLEDTIRGDPAKHLTRTLIHNMVTLYTLAYDSERSRGSKRLLRALANKYHLSHLPDAIFGL